MSEGDDAFVGSVPENYDRFMGPMLFEPQAEDTARRFVGFVGDVLEVAAGTGRLTRALVETIGPGARLTATDLNEPMLAIARGRVPPDRVRFQTADAQALPFDDASFDLVLCQFGIMFFPDKPRAAREFRRVLRRGGLLVFNVWDDLETNDFCRVMTAAIEREYPQDPPGFLKRGPFSYHDRKEIQRLLDGAGFREVTFEAVIRPTLSPSPREAATGLCCGSPLAAEIEAREPGRLPRVIETVERALRAEFGEGPISGNGHALLVTARG